MSKTKKVMITIAIIIVSLLLIAGGTITLLTNHYLSKITYEDSANTSSNNLSDSEILQELLADEPMTDEQNSSMDDISLLESQMKEQLENKEQNETANLSAVYNILLIGCDSRTEGGVGRSDTVILLSTNEDTKKIHITSILRDCYVSIPGKENNRLNAAYALGGSSLLSDTIETNFSIDVDKYVAVDFYSFVDIVDSIGGIEIDVNKDEIPVLNNYVKELNALNGRPEGTYYLTESGLQHLNGTQALGYSRIRYVGNGDFERTERQRTVITKIFEKIQDINIIEMNNLLNSLLPQVRTNLTQAEILSFMLRATEYLQYEWDSLRLPIDDSYQNMRINGMAVLGIDLEKNRKALAEFLYN